MRSRLTVEILMPALTLVGALAFTPRAEAQPTQGVVIVAVPTTPTPQPVVVPAQPQPQPVLYAQPPAYAQPAPRDHGGPNVGLIVSGSVMLGIGWILNFIVVVYICGLLPDTLIKSAIAGLLRLLYRVEVRGLENYAKAGDRAVVVVNHVSFLDGILLGAFLPGRPTFPVNTYIARRWWVRCACPPRHCRSSWRAFRRPPAPRPPRSASTAGRPWPPTLAPWRGWPA